MQDHTPYFPENITEYAPWVAEFGLLHPYGKCQCGCGNETRIAQYDSEQRYNVFKGQPYRFFSRHNRQNDSKERRFWSRASKPSLNACWEWQGGKTSDGYGASAIRNKSALAHRVAWELANGPIPAGMEVCHRCDNPPCVNPAHLFLGSHADNIRDMFAKGRGNPGGNRKKRS